MDFEMYWSAAGPVRMLWNVMKSKKTDGDFSPPAAGRTQRKSIRTILTIFSQADWFLSAVDAGSSHKTWRYSIWIISRIGKKLRR